LKNKYLKDFLQKLSDAFIGRKIDINLLRLPILSKDLFNKSSVVKYLGFIKINSGD
jgi:hypothetical protein